MPIYPAGSVRNLLESDLVTAATRRTLQDRWAKPLVESPRFFQSDEWQILQAVCARLIPQPDRPVPIDIAGMIDERLAQGGSDGWRYANMPPDHDAYRIGLRGLDETAHIMFEAQFIALTDDKQVEVLKAVQANTAAGQIWQQFSAARFFEELLAEAVEAYYSHPLAQEEIGYVGMADAHGWQEVGLGKLATHEPREREDHSE